MAWSYLDCFFFPLLNFFFFFLFLLSQDAKEKFQLLQKVISVLGDEEKRALYDQTGCIDDEVSAGKFFYWHM